MECFDFAFITALPGHAETTSAAAASPHNDAETHAAVALAAEDVRGRSVVGLRCTDIARILALKLNWEL